MNRPELGQSLNLSIEFIPEGRPNRSGRQIAPTHLTIHNTSNASPGADANAHSRFVREKGFYVLPSGKRNNVSWHYTVDDTRVIKHLPVNERAIHAGSGNGVSIAIEICMHAENDQKAANARAARLVAALMHDLKIPRQNVRPHKFWTGKICPTLLLSGFDRFCEDAASIVEALEVESEEEVPEVTDALTTEAERLRIAETAANPVEEEGAAPDHDEPDDEHERIAAEVSATVEGL